MKHNIEVRANGWVAMGVCLSVLLGGGLAHRWIGHVLLAADNTPVKLEYPLSTLPMQIGLWRGTDVPIDQRVLKVAGCDEHLCRRYVEDKSGAAVDLWVAYAARPATMLGHRPQVCYPAQGWAPAASPSSDQVRLADGTSLEFLVHQFTRNERGGERAVVLSYYVLHGHRTIEWTDFWGPQSRRPNLARDPNFYVAQVQVSCVLPNTGVTEQTEEVMKRFMAELAPKLDVIFPQSSVANRQ